MALDPSFAAAWAQLARASTYYHNNHVPTAGGRERVRVAAERALALGPDLPETAIAQISYHGGILGDWQRGVEDRARGLRVAPRDPLLLGEAAFALIAAGRWEEALDSVRRAQKIDPRSLVTARRLTTLLLALRRYPEALAAADHSLSLAPASLNFIQSKAMVFLGRGDLAGARAVVKAVPRDVEPTALIAYFAAYSDLYWVLDDDQQQLLLRLTPEPFGGDRLTWGLALAQTAELRGDTEAAREFAEIARAAGMEQLAESPDDPQRHVLLGLALAFLGRKADAVRHGEQGVALGPASKNAYTAPYLQHQLARIYRRVGEPDKALDLLEQILRVPYYVTPAWLRLDPEWQSLRDHPRFKRLVSAS